MHPPPPSSARPPWGSPSGPAQLSTSLQFCLHEAQPMCCSRCGPHTWHPTEPAHCTMEVFSPRMFGPMSGPFFCNCLHLFRGDVFLPLVGAEHLVGLKALYGLPPPCNGINVPPPQRPISHFERQGRRWWGKRGSTTLGDVWCVLPFGLGQGMCCCHGPGEGG